MKTSHPVSITLALLTLLSFPGASRAELSIKGCPSVYPLALRLSIAWMKSGGPEVKVEPMVTDLALNGVREGSVDIGMVSRPLTAEETGEGMRSALLASDGLTLFVNSANAVEGLTKEEVRRVLSGNIRRWSDLSDSRGSDSPIVVIHHRLDCGVTTVARMRFLGDMKATPVEGKDALSCPKVIGEVMATPAGLGYGPQTMTIGKPTVRVLTVDGVAPEPEEIRSGRYPYSFGLRLVFRRDPSPDAASFLEFAAGDEGRQVIAEAGYVLPKE